VVTQEGPHHFISLQTSFYLQVGELRKSRYIILPSTQIQKDKIIKKLYVIVNFVIFF